MKELYCDSATRVSRCNDRGLTKVVLVYRMEQSMFEVRAYGPILATQCDAKGDT